MSSFNISMYKPSPSSSVLLWLSWFATSGISFWNSQPATCFDSANNTASFLFLFFVWPSVVIITLEMNIKLANSCLFTPPDTKTQYNISMYLHVSGHLLYASPPTPERNIWLNRCQNSNADALKTKTMN